MNSFLLIQENDEDEDEDEENDEDELVSAQRGDTVYCKSV